MDDLTDPEVLSAFVRTLAGFGNITELELARRAGLNPSTLWRYKEKKTRPPRKKVARLASAVGLRPVFVETCLVPVIAAAVRSSTPLSDESLQELVRAAAALEPALAGTARPAFLALLQELEAADVEPWQGTGVPRAEDRIWAADACHRLMVRTAAERRELVDTCPEVQTWAVSETLCNESEWAAADSAAEALDLAELAVRIAERAQVDKVFRRRLLGYCLHFVANAQRVCGGLQLASETFIRAAALWQAGTAGDPDRLLASWRLLDRQASLRRSQGRCSEALDLLDRARAAASRQAHGRILLNKASTYLAMEESELALESLREAEPLIQESGDRRHLFGSRFNQARCLCDLRRFEEAEALLSRIRELADVAANRLDGVRLRWLEGKILAGFGQSGAARDAFDEVRLAFEKDKIAFDYALVCLELALLLLKENRSAEVRSLAEEMVWIFEAERVPKQALAALTVFRQAAEREKATVELTRRVLRFLERAQHIPELRFTAA
ncbi:MAG TPA: hypothetical protein VF756_25050 [Thermoanaerobaculia bacterium]